MRKINRKFRREMRKCKKCNRIVDVKLREFEKFVK